MLTALYALAGLALLLVTLHAYVLWRGSRPPSGSPAAAWGPLPSPGRRVACLGDSNTHGRIGHPWVKGLRRRFPEHQIINAGRNADVIEQLLDRLDPVLRLEPDCVIVLIGTNDLLASMDSENRDFYLRQNKLREPPSLARYPEQLAELFERLAAVPSRAIVTLPPVGEQPEAPVSQQVEAFNEVIRRLAAEQDWTVLPLHRALSRILEQREQPPREHYEGHIPVKLRRIYEALIGHYLLGRSWDAIGAARGQLLIFDHLHLGERAAGVMESLAADYLSSLPPARERSTGEDQ